MPAHNAALACFRLGELSQREGQLDEARANFALAEKLLERISRELPNEAYCQQRRVLLLADCPNQEFRAPPRAVELAKRVTSATNGAIWRYLALSQYRCGAWREAEKSLETSMQLRGGGDPMDRLLLALVQWQVGERSRAMQTYSNTLEAISTGEPILYGEIGVLGFRRLLAEAAATLRVAAPADLDEPTPLDSEN